MVSVSPYNSNSATEFAKNVPIVITFDHDIKAETKDDIKVYYSGLSDFSKKAYYDTSISSDNKTVTLTPKTMLPVDHNYETVTVTVPCDKIFYDVQNCAHRFCYALFNPKRICFMFGRRALWI